MCVRERPRDYIAEALPEVQGNPPVDPACPPQAYPAHTPVPLYIHIYIYISTHAARNLDV